MIRVNSDSSTYASAYADSTRLLGRSTAVGSTASTSANVPGSSNPTSGTTSTPATKTTAATAAQVKDAVDTVNKAIEPRNVQLQYEIDDKTKQVVTRVVDMTTGDVIRQIPNEVILRLARAMTDKTSNPSDSVSLIRSTA